MAAQPPDKRDRSTEEMAWSVSPSFPDLSFQQLLSAPTLSSSSWDSSTLARAQAQAQALIPSTLNTSPLDYNTSLLPNPSDIGWQMDTEVDQKKAMPYIGLGNLDSGFLSFTQCLQEGMSMDVMDYSDLSKSLGASIGASSSLPLPGFEQPEKSFTPRSSPFPGYVVQDNHLPSGTKIPSSSSSSLAVHSFAGSASGEASAVPSTPISSLSSSSSDEQDTLEECSHGGIKISEETPDELAEKSITEAAKKQNKPRKKGQKINRQPRIAISMKSEVEHLEDGYRWRKYGQKAVKNSPYPRSYYRCTYSKCTVKKRVERSFEDPSMVLTTYEGQHTHHSPGSLRASSGTTTYFGEEDPLITSFSESPFSFPFSGMPTFEAPSSLFGSFDLSQRHGWQLTAQGPPPPPPSPALPPCFPPQQNQSSTQPPTDMGLLEDILPFGVRKLP